MPRSQKTGTSILKLHFELHSNKYIFSQKFVLRKIRKFPTCGTVPQVLFLQNLKNLSHITL
jgi:hypothetical protein